MERTQTALDRISTQWLETQLELAPEMNVMLGRQDEEGRYTDFSPAGHAAAAAAADDTLAQARRVTPVDDVDAVTQAELVRTLTDALDQYRAHLWQSDLNVIASPVQGIREVFDLMDTTTADDWRAIGQRLRQVPEAVDGYLESLRVGIENANTPAIRQVREVLTLIEPLTRRSNFFTDLADRAPDDARPIIRSAAGGAAAAYARLATFLRQELAPAARPDDAVGRDVYTLLSRTFVGMSINLDETYAWGVDELRRTVEEQERVAAMIVPDGTVDAAIAHLDADPALKLHGTDALKDWMQSTSDAALGALDGTHFDIPDELRRLECMIAPTEDGGIYYTPPSEDFTRPGRMWWSVPPGVTEFGTWRELTTVYHEGVPGHHLQLGTAMLQPLNAWRRINWNSGHGEGWALYAERLMDDLGFLTTPADRLGMLDGQRLRAARVVLDIGVHLGLEKPEGLPGVNGSGPWTGDDAYPFLAAHVHMNDGFVRFESNRYLGWAGQAPSYKVGQRAWEQLRDDWTRERGEGLGRFHAEALAVGSVGLDTLRGALL